MNNNASIVKDAIKTGTLTNGLPNSYISTAQRVTTSTARRRSIP